MTHSIVALALLFLPLFACTTKGTPSTAGTPSSKAATPSTGVPRDPRIPQSSGDYTGALNDAEQYKRGAISFDELKARVIARKLPPHPLGCGYLMIPVPAPPPGTKFDAWMMPRDWERNFGEVAMVYWVGALTKEEYTRVHAAAHPGEK